MNENLATSFINNESLIAKIAKDLRLEIQENLPEMLDKRYKNYALNQSNIFNMQMKSMRTLLEISAIRAEIARRDLRQKTESKNEPKTQPKIETKAKNSTEGAKNAKSIK